MGKRGLIFGVLVLAVIFSLVEVSAACTDSDGGLNYYVYGYVNSTLNGTIYDFCGTGTILREAFCSGNYSYTLSYNCPYQCSGGRCITNTTNVTTTCYDTDGGTNYPVKGNVTVNLSNGTTLTYIDHCETPNVIFENLCLNNGVAFAIEYCTNLGYWGCSDGACINLPCGDTNGDTYVNNLDITRILNYLYKGGPAPVSMWSANVNGDSAVNAVDVSYLINYIYKGGAALKCAEINNGTQKNTDVTAGMNYNKVVSDFKKASSSPGLLKRVWDSLFGTKTGTGKVVTSFGNETCSDSDGGKSYYVKGTLNWQGQRYTDYCLSANITYGNLREFYCPAGNETSYFINYHCPNGCSNGVCKIVGKRCNFLTKIFGKCATPSVNTGVK